MLNHEKNTIRMKLWTEVYILALKESKENRRIGIPSYGGSPIKEANDAVDRFDEKFENSKQG
jgi:hypothetical protein